MGNHWRHQPLAARLWGRIEKRGECLVWTGNRTQSGNGYGQIVHAGRRYQAHRLAYELTCGPIARELEVCHRCDNPPCINPAHLFVGTRTDNMRDMARKGRHVGNAGKFRTHCKRGHPFEEANIRIDVRGVRQCRACDRIREQRKAG